MYTRRCRQDDVREGGCMNSLVPALTHHLNCSTYNLCYLEDNYGFHPHKHTLNIKETVKKGMKKQDVVSSTKESKPERSFIARW